MLSERPVAPSAHAEARLAGHPRKRPTRADCAAGSPARSTTIGNQLGAGEAISYLLKHWERLTLFLRVPGAPLDNNICERILKKAILHRKNALFYKTHRGAHVGDLFMSLIHTCELCQANPFEYLTELERHSREVAQNPQAWMPWNYRQTSTTSASPPAL